MTETKRRNWSRVAVLLVAALTLIALVFSLSSCGDSSSYPKKSEDDSDVKYVASVIASNAELKLAFIGASRGYNVFVEGFDDTSIDYTVDHGVKLDVAKQVMQKYIDNGKFRNTSDAEVFKLFMEELNEADVLEVVGLMKTSYDTEVSNGFPSILLVWIGKALGWLTGLVGNYYVFAIMIFAVIVEILMLPMAIKQQKNSIGMAKLRPKIAKIQKKYAGRYDQATQNKMREEILALQQKEGYSPFSGCLPMIIQIIIVGFVLYPIIQNPLRYMLDTSEGFSTALMTYVTAPRYVGGLGMEISSQNNVIEILTMLNSENIQGITQCALIANGADCLEIFNSLTIPNFTMFGINLAPVPKVAFDLLVLVPLLNVVVQWASMFLSRRWSSSGVVPGGTDDSQANASMKIMDFIAPAMTLFIMFSVPALIGVYWLFRSAVSILKQFIMKNALPIPKYTEEELKDMEKAEKERKKAQQAAIKAQPKYKSLHYIDEDDYDELPTVKSNTPQKGKGSISGEKPEIKD